MATSTIQKTKTEQIFYQSSSSIGTGTAFSCNWQNYDMLIITSAFYSNAMETTIVSRDYFSTTSSGKQAMVNDVYGEVRYSVYQNGNGSIIATVTTVKANMNLIIFGIKFS